MKTRKINCILLVSFVLFFTTSCKEREHEIIYLVHTLQDCVISYTNEFGNEITIIHYNEVGVDDNDWKMTVHFVPSLFDPIDYDREIKLSVSLVGDITNTSLVDAKIFVDNERVKNEFHIADDNIDRKISKDERKKFRKDVYLSYTIPKTFLEKYLKLN